MGCPRPKSFVTAREPGEHVWIEHERVRDGSLTEDEALQAHIKARAQDFRLITGSRLVFADGTPDIVVYPANRAGWGRLCRLLSRGNLRAQKGDCILHLADLIADTRDLLLIVMPDRRLEPLPTLLDTLAQAAPGAVWLGACMHRKGDDRRRLARLKALAAASRTPLIASNDALYDAPAQRDLQDVLSCIREGVTIERAGRLLEANAERHLKPPHEMAQAVSRHARGHRRDRASAGARRIRSRPAAL